MTTPIKPSQLRFDAYRQAFEDAGLLNEQPLRFIGVLTADAPGEIIELAIVESRGQAWVQRFAPRGAIAPGASRFHHLAASDFPAGKYPDFAAQWPEIHHRLTRPDQHGAQVQLVAWPGEFIVRCLNLCVPESDLPPVDIVDVQQLVVEANLSINPLDGYRPTLDSMRYTVNNREQDHTRAVSSALLTRNFLHELRCGHPVTDPPRPQGQAARV